MLYFTKCDLRIKALIQKSIVVNYAIRGKEQCLSSISNELEDDAKVALLKLEVYLDTLIDHAGIRKERNMILNYCTDAVINFVSCCVMEHDSSKQRRIML